eukprot:6194725-Pleurochrysis_carterae.AAC.8
MAAGQYCLECLATAWTFCQIGMIRHQATIAPSLLSVLKLIALINQAPGLDFLHDLNSVHCFATSDEPWRASARSLGPVHSDAKSSSMAIQVVSLATRKLCTCFCSSLYPYRLFLP